MTPCAQDLLMGRPLPPIETVYCLVTNPIIEDDGSTFRADDTSIYMSMLGTHLYFQVRLS